MNTRIYLRAFTKELDASRAMQLLTEFFKANRLGFGVKEIYS
jgi:hypothetical protein